MSGTLRRLDPLLVTALSAALGVIAVWRRPLSLDEAEHVVVAGRSWRGLVPFSHVDASGSAYLPVLKGWLHVGTSEWAMRAPSVGAVAIAAAFVCLLGARLFDTRIGLLAGVAFATNAFVVEGAQLVGPLAFALLAATLASWLLAVALETGRRALWPAYVVIVSIGVWLHASVVLVLAAHVVVIAIAPGRPLLRLLSSGVAAAIALPVAIAVLAEHRHRIDPLPQPGLTDVWRTVDAASGRNAILLAFAGVGLVSLAAGRAPTTAPSLVLLAAWITAPVAGSLILSIATPSLDPRYLLVASPALALLAAVGVTGLPGRPLVLACSLVLALAGYRLVQHYRAIPEDWRGATSFALAQRQHGDRIVVAPARGLTAFARVAGPDQGSTKAAGATAIVVVRGSGQDALSIARRAVHPPAYALLDERSFGEKLRVQRWQRTGLPAP